MDISTPGVADVEAKFDTIQTVPAFADVPQLTPLQFRPDTVQSSQIAPITVATTLLQASASVPDGSSLTNTTVSQSVNGGAIILSVARQVFIGSTALTSRMPEVISSSQFPHYEWDSVYDQNGKSLQNVPGTAVHKIQVRNNSGSPQIIIFQLLVRYIVNNSDNASI